MLARVPHRLGPCRHPLRVGGSAAHRDRVNDLTVGERVAVPAEVFGQVQGCFRDPRPDDEPQPGLVDRRQVRRGQHPGICDDDHVSDPVAFLEGLDHRDDRVGFGLVSLEAGDLEREP